MSVLAAWEASNQVSAYIREVEHLKYAVRQNFEDMDLENNYRRDEMEDRVIAVEAECDSIIGILNSLNFE
ncbi:hypothetical protein M2454_002438 [Aequitasia blattaphilus]|uniref:Uncharacterized protein n=1 Tax=Aequitasia blattaphilus TaxID=2949332 RepID=A0ABT1EB91_9FIRM|nr:hypothetical protein [Aequitasia blattaphilus]MCP1103083.1 hypothetical protein [Aequitasia blattaphilus]MCR8615723.1 hypothetical protein [Aequitasia blattaphilus]